MRTISLTNEQAQLARDLGVPLKHWVHKTVHKVKGKWQSKLKEQNIELNAKLWAKRNTWFGRDHKKTADAFDWHTITTDYLKIDPRSKEYYKIINICSRYYDKQKKGKK
jgi:hypothetical protein